MCSSSGDYWLTIALSFGSASNKAVFDVAIRRCTSFASDFEALASEISDLLVLAAGQYDKFASPFFAIFALKSGKLTLSTRVDAARP